MSPAGAALAGPAFYFVATLLAACGLAFAVLLLRQVSACRSSRATAASADAVRPAIHGDIVRFLAGGPDSVLRGYLATRRQELADTLIGFQSTVAGGARDRLCSLALDLGLVHEWIEQGSDADVMRRRQAMARLAFICTYEPCRRITGELLSRALEDADEEVRLSAARGLAQTGNQTDVEDVFLLALGPNPLTRVVLTEELRRHAMMLCAEAVPEVLASGRTEYVRAALEIVTAWERAIPLEQLRRFLDHRDRDIRLLALRLAPMAAPDPESRQAIIGALDDNDLEIRSLAIMAAGRLKLAEALPQLVHCLHHDPIEAARFAAEALATIPATGRQALEEASAGGSGVAARAAREILGRGQGIS